MGIYDRDYSREEGPGWFASGRTVVTNLILVNVGVYLVQLLIDIDNPKRPVTSLLGLNPNLFSRELLTHPWWVLQTLTYGFAHDSKDLFHVVYNMLGLWFFGRELESKYGSRAFLWFYLTAIIVAGLAWAACQPIAGNTLSPVVGASGAVSATMVLFAVNFPTRTLYFFGVVPIPVWALAIIWLLGDIKGAMGRVGPDGRLVAFSAHLAGAAYGFIFYQTAWSLLQFIPRNFSLASLKPRPRLKVHNPDDVEESLSAEVDEILRKINREGQESLTARERGLLEKASRRYQQKHR